MNEEKQPLGYLFESIEFYSPSDVDNFIDSINILQSYYVITKALEMAHSKNIFSLHESEILSKSLRMLNSEYLNNNDRTGQK
jgi:hypothetical protein